MAFFTDEYINPISLTIYTKEVEGSVREYHPITALFYSILSDLLGFKSFGIITFTDGNQNTHFLDREHAIRWMTERKESKLSKSVEKAISISQVLFDGEDISGAAFSFFVEKEEEEENRVFLEGIDQDLEPPSLLSEKDIIEKMRQLSKKPVPELPELPRLFERETKQKFVQEEDFDLFAEELSSPVPGPGLLNELEIRALIEQEKLNALQD